MKMDIARLWKGFWQLADPKIWIASTIPMAVGGAMAFSSTGRFELFWFVVSLAAVYLIEIGKNAFNEVMDYTTGVDRFVAPDKRTPFSGGKKTIVEGKLTVFEAGVIAVTTTGAACLIGLYIMFFREFDIFWIGIVGVLLSVFYSLPPFKLSYRGYGEVTVGLTFGPLILSGIYLVMTHTLTVPVALVGVPIGFLIANVLWINQFPDYEADKQGNKKNWVVRLGKEKAVRIYGLLYILAYIFLLIVGIVFLNPFWLLGLISIPLAVKSVKVAEKQYNNIPVLVEANAKTVVVYQLTGAAMAVAAVIGRFIHL